MLSLGKGTCTDLPANDWSSYLPVADHPEYPSLTASVCSAYAEASRNFLGEDDTQFEPFKIEKGRSRREPGITPRHSVKLRFDTWTEYKFCTILQKLWGTLFRKYLFSRFEQMCGSARLWGGVHFSDAVEEGLRIGRDVAKFATKFARLHIDPQGSCLSPDGPVVGPLARHF